MVVIVIGWPLFLYWYLRHLRDAGRLANKRVLDRVGWLYEQYRPEFMFYDVSDTMRKLYLVLAHAPPRPSCAQWAGARVSHVLRVVSAPQVSMVAFFPVGSIVQIVLSILVSVFALLYHAHARPYLSPWLNLMSGACLTLIWLTLQAGMMVAPTTPDTFTGNVLLIILAAANIVLLASPFVMASVVAVQIMPARIRRKLFLRLRLITPEEAAADEAEQDAREALQRLKDAAQPATATPAAPVESDTPHVPDVPADQPEREAEFQGEREASPEPRQGRWQDEFFEEEFVEETDVELRDEKEEEGDRDPVHQQDRGNGSTPHETPLCDSSRSH